MVSDKISVWDDDGGGSASVNLTSLCDVVSTHFGTPCRLEKIAEGGNHKVYEIHRADKRDSPSGATSQNAVVRVASPAFPRDKMISEISTIQYVAAHSSVPVPTILAWDVDAANPVGAEYMIMEKIPGVAASELWMTLAGDIKEKVVIQVAEHLAALFALRFDKAGSIYRVPSLNALDSSSSTAGQSDSYVVGPIVSAPFYRALDGLEEYPNTDLHDPGSSLASKLHSLRGPFTKGGGFVAHYLRAISFKMEECPKETLQALMDDKVDLQSRCERAQETMQRAHRVLEKAVVLCNSYPGDSPLCPGVPSTPEMPFTLHLDDFRLINILIDPTTGKVNGYIDFEGAITAPLWFAASVPDWIPDPDSDMATWYGGTPEDQRRVWDAFNVTMARCSEEWVKAEKHGRQFQDWKGYLGLGVELWASEDIEAWIDERLAARVEDQGA